MKDLSNIIKAPLYLIVKKITDKNKISLRIFPLMKAIFKDSVWSYPGKDGRVTIDSKDLNQIFEHTFNGVKTSKAYCLKSCIEKVYGGIEAGVKSKPTLSELSKSDVKKAPVKLLVPTKVFQARDMADINAVNDILSGKTNSFSVIYERYYNQINRNFMLGLRNDKDIADDLTMEFFVKIYEKINLYKPEHTFNAWITSIAKNHLIDYFRKMKAGHQMISIDRGLTNSENDSLINSAGNNVMLCLADESSLSGEEILINNEKKTALNRAILKLDKKSREMILMCVNNKTYKEISDETGISISNVKARIFRAKVKLREIFEESKGLMAAVA